MLKIIGLLLAPLWLAVLFAVTFLVGIANNEEELGEEEDF